MTLSDSLLLCSSGTFTRDPDLTDHSHILRYGPQLAVDGIEVIFYHAWYENDLFEQIAKDLRASGMTFPAVHAEKSIGTLLGKPDKASVDLAIDRLNINCYFAQKLGAGVLVLHLWGWPDMDNNFERNLEHFSLCVDFAWRYRLWLAVETIPCTRLDPLTRVRKAVEVDPRSRIALDTEFLAHHNQLDKALASDWLWQDNRVMHIHIKDFDGQMFTNNDTRRYLHPGEGRIDFPSFFRGLEQRSFKGSITLESPAIRPSGEVDLPRLQASLQTLRDWIRPGREA